MMKKYKNIDEYFSDYEKDSVKKLRAIRVLCKKLVKGGEEAIRYGMPTIRLNGKNLLHFAIQKNHIGFYPAPSGVKAYEGELKKRGFKYSKGAIQFPLGYPLPLPLIEKIIKFRVRESKKL